MGQIRTLIKGDIPQVADLYQKVFHRSKALASESLRSYFEEIFFNNPWYDEALSSIVYEEHNDKIVGFLGIIPRTMSFNGSSIQVAVGNHFMVDPDNRSTMAGLQLIKKFISGPQDLSMTDEGNDLTRKVWEGCGGMTSLLYSIHWRRPLRPSRYIISLFKSTKLPPILEFTMRPICHVVDAISARMPQSPFRQLASELSEEELNEVTLLDCISELSGNQLLLPEYNIQSLKWLIAMLSQKKIYGTLRKRLIRNSDQEIVGWYLYYLNRGGSCEVVQIGARMNSIKEVLLHLFYDAWRHGAIALHGRLDPKFIQDLSDQCCIFDRRGTWLLVHSRKPDILQPILRGDAFLTRLEGEWWLRSQEV